MSSNQWTYSLGATLMAIPTGATATIVVPPKGSHGYFLKYASGGSLAIVPGIGSSGTALGYVIGSTEVLSIDGPASFFLQAGGATAIAGMLFKFSSGGQSLLP